MDSDLPAGPILHPAYPVCAFSRDRARSSVLGVRSSPGPSFPS